MSVELKNWKELCKGKDERIKELEGKFDLIVERLEEEAKAKRNRAYMMPKAEVSLFAQYLLGMAVGLEKTIEIAEEVGGMNDSV